MDIDFLKKELVHENCLNEILFFDEIESTNEYAKKNKFTDNTLLITDKQTKGLGRFSRNWESSPGKDLTFTLIKKIKIGIDEVHLINFYTSYIIFYTLKNSLPVQTTEKLFLKWPNDILFNGKKISGILTDVKDLRSESKIFIIGSGINVNCIEFSNEVEKKATSLLKETGLEMDNAILLKDIIRNYYKYLDLLNNGNELLTLWKNSTDIIGKKISFRQLNDEMEISVKVADIDIDGGLIVTDKSNKKIKYHSGEISIGY